MKRFIYIIIGIVALSAIASRTVAEDQKVKYSSPWMSYILSDSDLKIAKGKALKGDAEAAFQVYQHYSDGKFDSIAACPWIQIAANKGHVTAQYNLGYLYMHWDIIENKQLARFWLKEAEKNGLSEATELLKELEGPELDRIDK